MKTNMFGWNVVHFNDDNTVAAVPDTWIKKDTCAWPKAYKDSEKIIASRITPNEKDFYFYNARKVSNKTYNSLAKAKSKLPKAMQKSDISSTEDEVIKSKPKYNLKRCPSPNPEKTKKIKPNISNQYQTSQIFPPCYIPKKGAIDQDKVNCKSDIIQQPEESDSDSNNSNSVFDDSDGDPSWTAKPKVELEQENDVLSPLKITPSKLIPSGSIKTISSPSGLWKVSKINNSEILVNSFSPKQTTNNSNITEMNSSNSVVKSSAKRQLHYSEVNQNQISDLYNMSLTSFTFIKYEMAALKMYCHTMNENIEALMKEKSAILSTSHNLDIESLFPVKNDTDLIALEEKLKDKDLRNSLVGKISLFVGKKDVGNSVRRIMARMFDDAFLVNYSLYGFKQKKSFTKLLSYRLIIDALRVHIKFKTCTDKEIDEPLGTWLSHAPYRIVPAGEKKAVKTFEKTC